MSYFKKSVTRCNSEKIPLRNLDGSSPRVLNLLAGPTGLSLGMKHTGLEVVAAIEINETAAASHGTKMRDTTLVFPWTRPAKLM